MGRATNRIDEEKRIMMRASLRHFGIGLYEHIAGRRITKAFRELLRTQWLSRDELFAIQQLKLQRLVEYTYRYVPHYRILFNQVGFEPGDLKGDPGLFRVLPTVDKVYMREHSNEFITTHPTIRKTIHTHSTSGSTGHPFIFWEDHNYRDYVTADILRHLTWSGWRFGEPHAYLWGLSFNQTAKQRIRSSLMNSALNRFVSNAYVLSEESMCDLVGKIRAFRPKLIFGYPSSLLHFARFVQEEGLQDIEFQAIYSSAEVLYPQQRAVIEGVFGGKVFNRYAGLETGGLACECEAHTDLHISVENCVIEVLNGDKPARPGESGQVVITNLNNYGFPFIRYRLGDYARLSKLDRCPCGRQHPMLEGVQGRQVDMFEAMDGRAVWGDFQSAVFEVEGIKQFQIVQKSLDLILIRLVTDDLFQKSQLDIIGSTVREAMGAETEVRFEFLDSIPLGSMGKFRYAISEVSNPK
jgi:phenylacetate-CoA ligase